jgi:hypothetical protein
MTILAGAGVSTTGCYTLEPTSVAVPAQGTRLAFAINDVGRVALGGVMGPELRRVEGNLQSKDGDDYVVTVAGVELLQGGFQAWAGETVRINSSYVSAVYEKKFSKGKTVLALGTVAVGIAVLSSRGLRSFIDPRDDGTPSDTFVTRRGRIPRFNPSLSTGLPPFLRSLNPPRSH